MLVPRGAMRDMFLGTTERTYWCVHIKFCIDGKSQVLVASMLVCFSQRNFTIRIFERSRTPDDSNIIVSLTTYGSEPK